MKLSWLLEGIKNIPGTLDREITGLTNDSRKAVTGDLFLAMAGEHVDGGKYIHDAIQKGVVAVLCSDHFNAEHLSPSPVPIISIPNMVQNVGIIASRFNHNPSQQMTIVGVTGTNGKTSITQFIAQSLKFANQTCGIIGTLGYGLLNELQEGAHTTPDAINLQAQLALLKKQGAEAVAMEVSSHGLDQSRTSGVKFDIAVFTNLTRDHLDYHGDMAKYAQAKRRLFYYPDLRHAVINTDDAFGLELAKELAPNLSVIGYGLSQPKHLKIPFVLAKNIHLNAKGISASVVSSWGEGQFRSRLLGRFNVSNLLAVLSTLPLLGIDFSDAVQYLESLETVRGRMQVFGGGKYPVVVVDYAHTPDALQQVLLGLREHTQGQLWCLFGCGGDRDHGKRPLMGQIAERYSDQLIITDDNPRTEDPKEIVSHIVQGLLCPWAVKIEHDRSSAIAHVICCAQPGDVVLVAGKGHENYQIIGTEKIMFNDAEEVQKHLRQYKSNGR